MLQIKSASMWNSMAHSEHNRQKKGGGFVLIIFGALLLFLAPNLHTDNPELGIASLVFGIIIGGAGFYIRFIKKPKRSVWSVGLFNKFKKESKKEESVDISVPEKIVKNPDIKKEEEIKKEQL